MSKISHWRKTTLEKRPLFSRQMSMARIVERDEARAGLGQDAGEPAGAAARFQYELAGEIRFRPTGLDESPQRQSRAVDGVDLVGLEPAPLQGDGAVVAVVLAKPHDAATHRHGASIEDEAVATRDRPWQHVGQQVQIDTGEAASTHANSENATRGSGSMSRASNSGSWLAVIQRTSRPRSLVSRRRSSAGRFMNKSPRGGAPNRIGALKSTRKERIGTGRRSSAP
jgi:hypothetical protein